MNTFWCILLIWGAFLAHLYKSTGRAIAVTMASALVLVMVLVKVFNPFLAEHDMPCLSKQCRSRSFGF